MKRNLALLGIMLLLPLSSFAQYSLLGQVTDETGTSIQGAQLCLYQDGELAGLFATTLSLSLQMSKPMVGLSISVLNWWLTADT